MTAPLPREVLVVDDEADIRELVEITLLRMGLKTQAAANVTEARTWLAEKAFALCITDMRLPDGTGIDLVRLIAERYPATPVAVITAFGNAEAAVESLKAGAFDFVSKPVNLGVLRKLVDTALKLKPETATPAAAPPADPPTRRFASASTPATAMRATPAVGAPGVAGALLGETPAIQDLRALIGRLARSQAPVHIAGESGTGKELVARMIHSESPRGAAPFVPVNCGAIPTELVESEFFGHVRGSFTGAVRDKQGLFQAAEGGTLFLDEVADLPLHMQVKLLRAVQERAVRPVGGDAEIPLNVRLISATHKNLGALVADGSFRQDLYYRLNVIEVTTPPLRDRAEDIPLLVRSLLQRLATSMGISTPPKLSSEALDKLYDYPFPGNVRELENVLERAMTLSDGSTIQASDLHLRPVAAEPGAVFSNTLGHDGPNANMAALFGATLGPMSMAPGGIVPTARSGPLEDQMLDIERRAIVEALEKARYNKTRAAEMLGMSFRSLRYRIKKLGIE